MIIALQTLVFFRESLLSALSRVLSPYYKRLRGTFIGYSPEDEDDDEEVFAEFDDEKGVVFYPPMYLQRYAAVSDCLMDERWSGQLAKVVDLGYHDMSFIKYLKDLEGVKCILGVDIESIPLRCSSDLLDCEDYAPKRENPLQVTLFQGNAADPDYRLIGCDAVVAIEMIEHMLPHDLDRLVHTVFGFIKPWVAIITTPNADFNVLFKSLEKNGLRRWDHFFEWTREQFHDWCSNIVSRYPQFTVTCQGIGPGPTGTEHHGCCSQLALFVNKSYVKQQNLNLDSLALVSDVPPPHNLAEIFNGFESPDVISEKYLSPNEKSLTNVFSNKQSLINILMSSSTPALSVSSVEHHDKTSQCNLDMEVGKNFLMFDYEDMYYTTLIPRRKVNHRVYEIEDINSRLNCTTFQARKFSKTTQNLMAKNRIDSLAHTKEVVREIRHLTKMLNFNRDSLTQKEDGYIWCNINWGEDAPYWNQYFKVIRDYNYPFEQKSEECKILDLISEEINRLIDMHYEEEITSDTNKLEIPIGHLMKVVRHITSDVDKVKDLLEWNGYEVTGDYVIHSRLVVDATSLASSDVDWPENDTASELDTIDVQSTTISDGSAIVVQDFHGRCLRRALDMKVQALRGMLSADEDITTELDRVVCRLMKLALRSSKGKQEPPPARWMQFKLLDLLTLTEKAISRRKRHYLESFPLKAIGFDKNITILNKMITEDRAARMIVDKYNHFLQEAGNQENFEDLDFGFDDELEELGSNEYLKDSELDDIQYTPKPYVVEVKNSESSNAEDKFEVGSFADQIPSDSSKGARKKYVRSPTRAFVIQGDNKKARKRSHSKITDNKSNSIDRNSKKKKSKTNFPRKPVISVKTSNSLLKMNDRKVNEYENYSLKSRRVFAHKKLQPTASKPIPGSLIELCEPRVNLLLHSKKIQFNSSDKENKVHNPIKEKVDVSATEESVLIDIVMDDMQETIALRRSIGTDADKESAAYEQEEILGNFINITRNNSSHNKLHVSSERVQSPTIFLFDINEPSTSKGIRHHISMDVQCGTDTILPPTSLVTPPTSATNLPQIYSAGIRIDSLTNFTTRKKNMDFGSCTNNDSKNYSSYCKPNLFSKGIKIEDSQDNLKTKTSDFGTSTNEVNVKCKWSPMHSPKIKIKYSFNDMQAEIKCSDFGMSTCNDNEKCESPRSVIMKSSSVMTEIINTEKHIHKTQRSVSPPMYAKWNGSFGIANSVSGMQLNDEAEELTSITPGTKSPYSLAGLQANDSLSNLLVNFNVNTDHQRKPCTKETICSRSRSPGPKGTTKKARIASPCSRKYSPHMRNRSPDAKTGPYDLFHTGIKNTGYSTDTKSINAADYGTMTTVGLKRNSDSSRPQSPIVYTSVKMIDLLSNVSIEQDAEIQPLSEPSKLVSSMYVSERPEFRFKINNSLYVKNSKTRDIDTYMTNSNEQFGTRNEKAIELNEKLDDRSCTDIEIADHEFEFTGNVKIENYFTKVNLAKQSALVQNDSLELDTLNRSVLPPTKSFGFKIKGSDENVIKKVEFSTTRVELLSDALNHWSTGNHLEFTTKTDLLKPVSSRVKMEDSTSECSPFCPSPKSIWQGIISPLKPSELRSKQSLNRDVNCLDKMSSTKIAQSKLSCGGLHVHSFKDKQVSEDILYLGEWKRHAPKFPRIQYQGSSTVAKKVLEPLKKNKIKKVLPRKEMLQFNKLETNNEIKNDLKRPLQVRSTKPVKTKQESIYNKGQSKKVALPNLAKTIKANSKTKVATKIMTSTITSKTIKSIRSEKKPLNCVAQSVKNDCGAKSEPIRRNGIDCKYLPRYLRRRKSSSGQNKLNNNIDSIMTAKHKDGKNNNNKEDLPSLNRSNSELIKSDLMKLQDNSFNETNFIVFRNETENTYPTADSSQSADVTNRNEITNKRRSLHKRSPNHISPTSSTCSTTDSISTVRVTNNLTRASRRHSFSSNKSSIANVDSESSPSANKNRKFSKKSKVNKKSDGKDHNNKENIAESSKKCYPEKELGLQNKKNAFMGRSKNVFKATLNDSGLAINEKHQTSTMSSIKIPAIESNDEKKGFKIPNIQKKQSEHSSYTEYVIKKHGSMKSEPSNLVLLIEPQKDHIKMNENIPQHYNTQPEEPILKTVDSDLLTEWFERGKISAIDRENTENAILAQMRQIVEERLDFIGTSLNVSPDNSSPKSCRTVVPACDTDLDNTLKNEIENVMNHSLDAVLDDSDFSAQNESSVDADLISFKSVTSASRYSEYYMAESDTSRISDSSENKVVSSVLDIFERKDLNTLVQNPPGALAVQAFSGFSMNIDRVMGDHPDYVTALDSETSSLAVTRQATSEEMFISGRSSETYESCVLEEEVSVPDWLFHVMNPQLGIALQRPDFVAPFDSETGSPALGYSRRRHQTIEEEEEDQDQELVQLRMPMVEPMLDVNGNVVEPGIGLGAGAGDGRGMHSDHSQDSSGRGSSLSSTDASSGQQSEAILIDPSGFTTQFELLHEPVGSSMAVTTLVVPARSSEPSGRQGRSEVPVMSTSRNTAVRTVLPPLTSDGEADVSSLDTDVPDSS